MSNEYTDMPFFKKQKLSDDLYNKKQYTDKHKYLLQSVGQPFIKAYVSYLVRELAYIPHPANCDVLSLTTKYKESITDPLKQFAEQELGMDQEMIAQANKYITRAEIRTEQNERIMIAFARFDPSLEFCIDHLV